MWCRKRQKPSELFSVFRIETDKFCLDLEQVCGDNMLLWTVTMLVCLYSRASSVSLHQIKIKDKIVASFSKYNKLVL